MQEIQTTTHVPIFSRSTVTGRWLLPILALLVLIAIGLAFRLWSARMPDEDSPEVTFARDMSAHHDQAVEMAVILRDRGIDEELRTIALDITLTQRAQSGMMQGWLQVWGQPISAGGAPMGGQGEMMGMATYDDIKSLMSLPPAEMEIRFLQLMIRHHQGGVIMAEEALRQTARPEVVRLATGIVTAQQSEITGMEMMLEAREAPLPEPVNPMPGHGAGHE